ncbi:Hypothetical_protein [Hexamita inflata]|uniref:Hypothetical_protein n=2 Tax=Hexamita inflata TaxID=28002 RepID=A0AA86PGX9_9EUKA|nr:Hypothetical protein HINF_LOCUS26391 [Hexamita inflata]
MCLNMKLVINFQQHSKEIEIRGHTTASCLYLHVQALFQIQNFVLVSKARKIQNKGESLTQLQVTDGSAVFVVSLCKSRHVENKLQKELKEGREQYQKQFKTNQTMQEAWRFVTQNWDFDMF